MQYRHSFHAGNFADVHKHVALLALLESLQRKAKGFLFLDTHAGGGLYDLRGEQSRRGGESEGGIAPLTAAGSALPRTPELAAYLQAVARLRAVTGAATYPGSPLLAAAALREVDRATCVEVIAQEARHLQVLKGEEMSDSAVDFGHAPHGEEDGRPVGAVPPILPRNGEVQQPTLAQKLALVPGMTAGAIALHRGRAKLRQQVFYGGGVRVIRVWGHAQWIR